MDLGDTSFRIGNWTIDPVRRTAASLGVTECLSANEVGLLTYLASRKGPVDRAELLTEVFGYAAGVRSRAVDMALTRLRAKLERDPADPALLRSTRGKGVWLEGLDVPGAPAEGPPRFGSPYVPRPRAEAAVRGLWDAGWRVVTIVGPGGAGKTRLLLEAASGIEGHTAFLAVGAVTSSEDLIARLAGQLGIFSGEPVDIARALEGRGVLVVLDEAEQALDACRGLTSTFASTRFLVSSRQPLHIDGEGVHALEGLSVEEGRSFLRSRLAASRWGVDAPNAVLDGIRAQVDGLPLGLELAAAYPDGLDALLTALESNRPPAPGEWLETTLARSLDPLPEDSLALLCALAVPEGALTREDVADWRGPRAAALLTELADRSLLQRSGWGWMVLRTVRAAVRQLPVDWEGLQRDFDSWLVRRLDDLGYELDVAAGPAVRCWQGLELDFTAALERAGPRDIARLVRVALPFFDALGPRRRRDELLRRALVEAPDDPAVLALSALLPEYWREADRIAPASEDPDPTVRALALMIQSDVGLADPQVALELLAELTDPRLRLKVEGMAMHSRLHRGEATVADARAFLARLAPRGVLSLMVREALARHARYSQDPHHTAILEAESARIAKAEGLHRYAGFFSFSRALALGEAEPREGIEALRRLAAEDSFGEQTAPIHYSLAQLYYLTGDLEQVVELLGSDTPSALVRPVSRVLATCLRQIASARLGRSELRAFPQKGLEASLAAPIEKWFEAERCLLLGDPDGAGVLLESLRNDPLERQYGLSRLVASVLERVEKS